MFGKYTPGEVVLYRMEHWPENKTEVGVIYSLERDGMWLAYEMEDGSIIREYEIIRLLVGRE